MLFNHCSSQTAFSPRGCPALLQQAAPRRSSCCCAWQKAVRKPSKEYMASGVDELCSPEHRDLVPQISLLQSQNNLRISPFPRPESLPHVCLLPDTSSGENRPRQKGEQFPRPHLVYSSA